MNRLSKSIGGLLLGITLLFGIVFSPAPASATSLGVENVAYVSGSAVDPCLNNGGAFGFVFCPAVDTFAGVIDYFLDSMQEGFNWAYLTDDGPNVIGVWSSLLPIANILFAMVFLFVIYSVATGSGLTNYNIKKIMPRLALVAIAVNVSYYICAALIDLSNIVGANIYEMVYNTLANGHGGISFSNLADSVFNQTGAGAGLVSATNSGSIGALLILVVNMTVVLLGVGAVFVGVAARNVILMMLLLASPLAFSTALLPNTETIFRRWGNNYLRLLVVYPAFMFVWAICRALQAVFLSDTVNGPLELILAMLLSVAPAVVIIPLFKATGGLTGKIANVIQRGSTGLSSRNTTTETTNKKDNRQTIDQINQKKFTTNHSLTTNINNNVKANSAESNLTSDSTTSISSSRTQIGQSTTTTTGRDRKGRRSSSLSANMKDKVGSLQMQGLSVGSQNTTRARSASPSAQPSPGQGSMNRGAENIQPSQTSISSSNIFNKTAANIGGADKLVDALNSGNNKPQMHREHTASAKPTIADISRTQKFADTNQKSDKVFDVSAKESIADKTKLPEYEKSEEAKKIPGADLKPAGEPAPNINKDAIAGNIEGVTAPSIVGNQEVAKSETAAADSAVAPSIVNKTISDTDRKNRFAGEAGQKAMADSLKVTNFGDFLPSDIDYILGIGPLQSSGGEFISPISSISGTPEYDNAVAVITGFIEMSDETTKKSADVLKWQKKLGLL